MKNLIPCATPLAAPFDDIADCKYKDAPEELKRLRTSVLLRYDEYDALKQRLESIAESAFSKGDAKILRDCYDCPTIALNQLRKAIKQDQPVYGRSICAYCGIDSPGEVEHYLPKSEFPEFSVCHYNLLPACGTCNNKKRVKWREGGVRRILHLYFDRIPSGTKWLHAEVSVEDDTPVATFSLNVSKIVGANQRLMIAAHYEILDLLNRYSERSAEVFTEVETDVLRDSTAEDLEDLFRGKSEKLGRKHGVNFWKSVLYQSIADSERCVHYLLQQAASDQKQMAVR